MDGRNTIVGDEKLWEYLGIWFCRTALRSDGKPID
jgi:hypothetical protein